MPRLQPTETAPALTKHETATLLCALEEFSRSPRTRRERGDALRIGNRLGSAEEPNILRMLDVSTVHLTAEERDDLEYERLPCQVAATAWGGIVHTAGFDVANNEDLPTASPSFIEIMRHALARGCAYVMFDADAAELTGFPAFPDAE